MSTDPIADLRAADDAYRDAVAAVEEIGEADAQTVAEYYRDVLSLFDEYEEPASGSGNFEAYIEFQEAIVDFVESLPEDLPRRDAFEVLTEIFDQRRLSHSDFEDARRELRPAAEIVERLETRKEALERYRDARHAVERRRRELRNRIDELEEILEHADVDFDADTDALRAPIDEYNDAVETAFRSFKRESSARSVLAFVVATEEYPLVEYRQPPAELVEFVESAAVGTEPIQTLLEYADYSRSKLQHYVDQPQALKRHIATNQTYLERLDADPLRIQWPPPSAETLRFRCRELIPLVDRFAPAEVLTALRTVRERTLDAAQYRRRREAAVAMAELSERDRERLQDGTIEAELATAREEYDRLTDALESYPDR
ncbi:MAG: hypothetical protein SVG88_05180 [Halobacteriales archaeon]|nr:hypothetical protein [Halobacteriales archaeon]